jgi:putative DeoR family transcriptional regulator (stage III sporulation protein D)
VRTDIRDRVLESAEYILRTGATVRACAERFAVSKTTVHKDMRKRLPDIDRRLAEKVAKVLEKNLEERHIRGGMATRRKYKGEEA